jgi:hypothetical protein
MYDGTPKVPISRIVPSFTGSLSILTRHGTV